MGVFSTVIQTHNINNRRYIQHFDKFFKDVDLILVATDENDMNVSDIDELIGAIAKTGYASLISRHTKETFDLITTISKKYTLSKQSLTKIFGYVRKHSHYNDKSVFGNFKWADNLVELGVVFTPEQKALLIDCGHVESIDSIMKCSKLTAKELVSLLANKTVFRKLILKKKSLSTLVKNFKLKIDESS
jgi:antitoxin component HigA of HigAB toxin-antitoxin module